MYPVLPAWNLSFPGMLAEGISHMSSLTENDPLFDSSEDYSHVKLFEDFSPSYVVQRTHLPSFLQTPQDDYDQGALSL